MEAIEEASFTCRVGIDFGETIGRIDEDEPLPYAFEMIRHLICKFGAENNFIISKAGPDMERRTLDWIDRNDFYSRTGFLQSNVIFVREYHEKAVVVQANNINIFIDDSVKVVRSLSLVPSMKRIFWMHAKARDILLISKECRHRIAIVHGWNRTMKYFQKIKSNEEKIFRFEEPPSNHG